MKKLEIDMLLAIENGGKNVYGINLYFSLLSLCFVLLSLDKTVHFSLTSLSVRIIKETGKKEWFVLFEIDSVCLDLSSPPFTRPLCLSPTGFPMTKQMNGCAR